MKIIPALFEEREIRRRYDEPTETWFFSVVDIIQVLTQQADYQTARKYWHKLKERLSKEGSESVTNCHQLKLRAEDDAFSAGRPFPIVGLGASARGRLDMMFSHAIMPL